MIRLVVLAALALAGCNSGVEAAERARVLRAADALRDAPAEPLEARKKLLDELFHQPVELPAPVRARDTCGLAYRLLLEGEAGRQVVKKALDGDQPPTPQLAQQLLDAEAKIQKSARVMPDCDAALHALRHP